MRDVQLSIDETFEGLTITMPPARNPWIIGLGLGAGVPYLLVVIAASIAVPLLAPPEMRKNALLGTVAMNLLFFFAHVLAAAGVWLAAYDLSGFERLIVRPDGVFLRRRALGMTLPIKLGRRGQGSVKLLDHSQFPGRSVPHPRLEIRSGGTAARFGAGLTAEEAERVRNVVEQALDARNVGEAEWVGSG
ncbi:MAG: hypothetical protein CVT60_06285 [Actinobacteria bacterium HGW-Actinobacteria-10]|jgi:hypothetical protein|nr:MAG: hypothetical protein CVT60_06285 [Actinobacteria bacterium HGW-Actinobacteria-10]